MFKENYINKFKDLPEVSKTIYWPNNYNAYSDFIF
jgi:hypothetical protein